MEYKKRLLKNPKAREEYERFGLVVDALVKARRRLGMTQGEVAEKAGISRSAVARTEGLTHGIPKVSTLQKIASALDIRLIVKVETKKRR